jgi:hypothetical protein
LNEEGYKNMPHLERTKSDLSETEKQSQSKNSFDLLRNSLTRSNSLPKEYEQNQLPESPSIIQQENIHNTYNMINADKILNNISEIGIAKYQEEYDLIESKYKEILYRLEELLSQSVPWQKGEVVINESKQVLDDYKQLKSDPQRYQEELKKIDDKVNLLLEKFHSVEKEMKDLAKRLNGNHESKEEIKYFMLARKRVQLYKDIHKVPLTPIDKVYEQHEKHCLVYNDMQSIRGEEWGRLESGTALPSMTAQLLKKVQRIQKLLGQWCSVELRAKVQELESEVEQLSGNPFRNSKHVEKFTEHYNLLDELEEAFDSYNPYRSREHVSLWEGIVSPQKFGTEKTDSPDESRPEKQLQSELLRNNLTCPSSQPKESNQILPSEAPDILQKETNKALDELSDEYTVYKEKINEYQNSYNKYKNELSTLKAHLKASSKQLVRWREQSNEYQAIYQESKQVLEDYEKLKNDPQEFEKQHRDIDTNVASKRKELHAVEQEILALTKEQGELHDKIQKDTRELGEQDSPNQQRLQEVENRLILLPAELSSLRKQLQEASITPTDRLNAEDNKYRLAFNEIKTIGQDVDTELTKYSLNTTPEAQGSGTASLPEVTGQINNLLSEVKSIQALANDNSECHHELQLIHEPVKILVQNIEQIDQEATAFKEQLEEHINNLKAEVLKHNQFKQLSLGGISGAILTQTFMIPVTQ